ncbi:MAG: MBOAT family protein [Ignavibacteriae bacterium]|nr:MBOAT family protein [Ignavibacteriota bacterium]
MNLTSIINIIKYNPENPAYFTTGFFLWFISVFIILYSMFYKSKNARLSVLMVFSLYFYYKCCGSYVLLLISVSLINYFLTAFLVSNVNSLKKAFFWLSLSFNLGTLIYFKYTNFFLSLYGGLSGNVIEYLSIILPVGISFFIFQNIGYIIDVYKGNIPPAKNILEFISFTSFFPVIQAGPILRAGNYFKQIKLIPYITNETLSKAVLLIISGLLKKCIIGDYIGVNFVDRVFDNPLLYSGFENLFAVFGYALQIYCDFSGYSDIAIGIALLIGIHIPANFNLPYKSLSIKEFWQRWHISLSSWFRDYLFLPIAYSVARKLKNNKFLGIKAEAWSYNAGMIITMLLCGLWHGASWTFVAWGGLYGIGISVERIIKSRLKFKSNIYSKSIGAFITFLFICFCWIFFRANNFGKAFSVISQIFNSFNINIIPQIIMGYKEVFILIIAGYTIHFIPEKYDLFFEKLIIKSPLIIKALYLIFVIWIVVQLKSAQLQPFIYFQF